MNILDENIPESQRQLLRIWKIRSQQVGHEIGRQGMKDEEIIPFLHTLRQATFFTRDLGFYNRSLCHLNYCLVVLDVGQYEVASFIRRILKHERFNTKAKMSLSMREFILCRRKTNNKFRTNVVC